jgi:hypothetical protein
MRKMISVLSFLGIIMLLLPSACKRTMNYSELPGTLANRLQPTSYPGVFIAGINDVNLQSESKTASLFCPKACATKTTWWVQVTYPVTICYPPDIIIGGVLTQGKKAPDSISGIIMAEGTAKEMVSTRTINGFNPLWCKTKYGPWIAEITDTENCDNSCGEGSHLWTLEILGSQGSLFWTWNGTMDGRPQEVQFIGQPWVRNSISIDCRPFDMTSCN